jgi:signal transduction histidine kinase
MINTIHQITAANMQLRLGVPDTKDEVQDLAETFNGMLNRLEHAFATQRRLFEDLSHELKTPLTIIKGEFEVALKKTRSAEEYTAVLKSTLEEADRLIKLAENLLMLAKFDAKEVFLDKKRLDLGRLLQAMVNNMRSLAELKNVKLFFKPAGDIQIYGDESQLKALFINIIDNAIKYTPEKGEVWVEMSRSGKDIKVAVRDSGPGISGEDIPRIFDRFYRAPGSRGPAGFGLGLSIAKSIAESHDGRIDAASSASSGATFTVTLPAFAINK